MTLEFLRSHPLSTSHLLWILVACLFTATAYLAWARVAPSLFADPVLITTKGADCDLRSGPCEAQFIDGRRAVLEIKPHAIPVAEKLELRVVAEGIDASRVEVDFAGVDMNMGFNRVTMDRTGPGTFIGTGMLPVCVRARMTWNAGVLLYTDTGLMAAYFRFDTFLPHTRPFNSRLSEVN